MKWPEPRTLSVILLLGIFALGFGLRLHHIDYPPIGYHAMKEVHYLSVAKGYLDHGDFLHKRVLYSAMSAGPGYLEAFPQVPILSWSYYLLWRPLGVRIWIARMVVVLCSLGTIVLTYLVGRRLTGSEEISLLAAFFMAVLPVSIFFGRNIQPDMTALFLVLLATNSYLKWLDGFRARDLAGCSLSLVFAGAVKITFLISVIPLIFMFPYSGLRDRTTRRVLLRQSAWIVGGIVCVAAWLLATRLTSVRTREILPSGRLFLAEAFTPAYWRRHLPLVWKYVGENFTYLIFGLSAIGLVLSVLDHKTRLSRYLIGAVVSAVVYFLLISDYAVRHGYYHIPFLPLICYGAALTLTTAASLLVLRGRVYGKYAAVALVILFAVPSLVTGFNKHFDILMIGSDVAGRYIGKHSGPSDRIFISYGSPSHKGYAAFRTQFYGTLWEAGRRGALLPDRLDRIVFGERERQVRWILLYETEWRENDREILDYIHRNYTIRQIGYKGGKVLYYVLERGGGFDTDAFAAVESRLARRYEFSYGDVDLYVKEI